MKRLALIFLCLSISGSVLAKDLGRIGATFPIGEVDMLLWIEQRLKHLEKTGELADMKNEFQERVKDSVERPPSLHLPTTLSPKVFYVDPSLTIPQDISDPKTGQVFIKAGTKVNPFDSATWGDNQRSPKFEYSHVLVFFDADDMQQITWARDLIETKAIKKPIKWILTGGSPNQMALNLDTRIFFDQKGMMTDQLKIRYVPSLVEQNNVNWQVTEFDVSNLEPYEGDYK